MSVDLHTLLQRCNEILQPELYRDYCPNGLQVEGKAKINRIVSGVTACQALIDQAVTVKADAILVHHGYFWKGEDAVLTGIKRRRIQTLLAHDISLLAYHLPLDAHPELGNNVCLAKLMDWPVHAGLGHDKPYPIGNLGTLVEPRSVASIAEQLEQVLGRKALLIQGGEHKVKQVAWCTGGAQDYIEQAFAQGADLFVSGEISERTVHFAREAGIHYIAAGHHATERYGIQALAEQVADQFGVEHQYIDIDNPV